MSQRPKGGSPLLMGRGQNEGEHTGRQKVRPQLGTTQKPSPVADFHLWLIFFPDSLI